MADPSGSPDGADIFKPHNHNLQALTPSLHSSVSDLSVSSRILPFDRDFHFYYNFDEFKGPIREIASSSELLLHSIGSSATRPLSAHLGEFDDASAYDWLVNINDEALERFDASINEFQRLRKVEEERGKRIMDLGDGFQVVHGKKKKSVSVRSNSGSSQGGEPTNVKVTALRDKKISGPAKYKVPFHIPTITRPQDEYNILVNNSNQPFQHVWLQKSEDGERFIHPLENLSVSDFVDKDVSNIKPEKPPALEDTPFKLVSDVKNLKALAAKLRAVSEFSVDLEHNQYRSFQGLTCLMQISTRSEDFVVDALKLRIHIGPYLREVFKDPAKKKVMHGADRDIVWLQRDFGIYVCNMFDTGQASRVLKLERNSLEFLLHHFCGVTANKEYQNADWRLRPLPEEMTRYAREDTHYLLYIYDLMRLELYKISEKSDSALIEVYKRSADICMQLYEKELLTESSYLHIYGLQGADINAQQLSIVSGLCEWRDAVARAEDESTGYILPNKTLLEIAKCMPVTTGKLHRIIKSKHPYIERNLASVVNIVRQSLHNASAFESMVEQLKQARIEATAPEETHPVIGTETVESDAFPKLAMAHVEMTPNSLHTQGDPMVLELGNSTNAISGNLFKYEQMDNLPCSSVSVSNLENLPEGDHMVHEASNSTNAISENMVKYEEMNHLPGSSVSVTIPDEVQGGNIDPNIKNAGATIQVQVQVLKKPTHPFGAMLGPKRKFSTEKNDDMEKKLEQIRNSVSLPFHSFLGKTNAPIMEEVPKEEPAGTSETHHPQETFPETSTMQTDFSNAVDVIILGDDSDEGLQMKTTEMAKQLEIGVCASSGIKTDSEEEEPMTLSELSSSFRRSLDSVNQDRKNISKVKNGPNTIQVKPFDYKAARSQVRFGGEDGKVKLGMDKGKLRKGAGGEKNGSNKGQLQGGDATDEFRQGRRRLAFPASGNRSATFH
ncbi:hypothetical protein SAY87_020324 [Trapa incisa]|uniref:HRDC domain-containing protein n=1 Tax=Trapa incisa TaxID=236973 RepID=A0AAN7K778_9MYRT|nr:hypothetical protein SAY87_020324 [Trapa incisa]